MPRKENLTYVMWIVVYLAVKCAGVRLNKHFNVLGSNTDRQKAKVDVSRDVG